MTVVPLEYIEVDDRGVAKLIGSRSKVRQVVMDVQNGMTPEQVHDAYPHLSMAQIHAALAYYYDHKEQVDAEIEEGRRLFEEFKAKNPKRMTREDWKALWQERCPDRPFPGDAPAQEGSA